MSDRQATSTKYSVGRADPPDDDDFWDKHGWNTTTALCFGIGGFGLLQFLIGLAMIPTHPVLDSFELLVVYFAAPLLAVLGVTGFGLAAHNVARHWLLRRDDLQR